MRDEFSAKIPSLQQAWGCFQPQRRVEWGNTSGPPELHLKTTLSDTQTGLLPSHQRPHCSFACCITFKNMELFQGKDRRSQCTQDTGLWQRERGLHGYRWRAGSCLLPPFLECCVCALLMAWRCRGLGTDSAWAVGLFLVIGNFSSGVDAEFCHMLFPSLLR